MHETMQKWWTEWIRRLKEKDRKAIVITAGVGVFCVLLAWGGGLMLGTSDDEVKDQSVAGFRDEYRELEKEFGDRQAQTGEVYAQGLEDAVTEYLKSNVGFSSFGDEVFCSYEELGVEQDGEKMVVILWAYCAEVYEAHQTLRQGGGVSTPVVLSVTQGATPRVESHQVPMSGNRYDESVRTLFPEKYHALVFPSKFGLDAHNERVRWLSYQVYEKAADFYQFEG